MNVPFLLRTLKLISSWKALDKTFQVFVNKREENIIELNAGLCKVILMKYILLSPELESTYRDA